MPSFYAAVGRCSPIRPRRWCLTWRCWPKRCGTSAAGGSILSRSARAGGNLMGCQRVGEGGQGVWRAKAIASYPLGDDFVMESIGGWGGIRTHETPHRACRFSRPVPSTARPPIRDLILERLEPPTDARATFVHRFAAILKLLAEASISISRSLFAPAAAGSSAFTPGCGLRQPAAADWRGGRPRAIAPA